jgi:hypothetical protein
MAGLTDEHIQSWQIAKPRCCLLVVDGDDWAL